MYLKDVEIAKKVHIVGFNDENMIYYFGTDKGTNRPTNTDTFSENVPNLISLVLAHYIFYRYN